MTSEQVESKKWDIAKLRTHVEALKHQIRIHEDDEKRHTHIIEILSDSIATKNNIIQIILNEIEELERKGKK